MNKKIFINRRRKGLERRSDEDPCKDLDIDIYHRKRRKSSERRHPRTLDEDYYAFVSASHRENSRVKPSDFPH